MGELKDRGLRIAIDGDNLGRFRHARVMLHSAADSDCDIQRRSYSRTRLSHLVIVIDISEDQSDLQIFINPEITRMSGQKETEEGCLSVPGIYAPVTRAARQRRAP